MRRRTAFAFVLAGIGAVVVGSTRAPTRRDAFRTSEPSALRTPPIGSVGPLRDTALIEEAKECASRSMRLPNGSPAIVSCGAARSIVGQVRSKLAAPETPPSAQSFADATAGWLDPHGLWSAAPDAPPRAALRRLGPQLLREIQAPPSDPNKCDAAAELGGLLKAWVAELRHDLDTGRRGARSTPQERAFTTAAEGIFQDDPVTRPARELARDLGHRLGAFERAYGDAGGAVTAAASRLLPDISQEAWTGIVLGAAVRAYVPAVDVHGQWAPLDEEWSLYSSDPALESQPKLWGRMVRTALGVSIREDPAPPLIEGDLVLSVGGVATGGLSVEQIEQLAYLEPIGTETMRDVVVLRRGELRPRTVSVDLVSDEDVPVGELSSHRIAFGDGEALVLTVPDVPDDLGEEIERAVLEASDSPKPPVGILLDLRGNGGGSIDGASGAIGVFLPGAPSFPLRRRDGQVEVQHATTPSPAGQWHGPVATLVDGYTASAAEMIAGALSTYRRGTVVGARTFGKGCVQEYFDDRAGVGVLRLTTMLFCLPDGTPLQGVGIPPDVRLVLPGAAERERLLPGAMQPWRGPDVRSSSVTVASDWPSHAGRVGPCEDAAQCAALRRLGLPRRTAANVVVGRSPRRSAEGGRGNDATRSAEGGRGNDASRAAP